MVVNILLCSKILINVKKSYRFLRQPLFHFYVIKD